MRTKLLRMQRYVTLASDLIRLLNNMLGTFEGFGMVKSVVRVLTLKDVVVML